MGKTKKSILVVGPPRSGTSAVANAISELGVYFGDPAKFVDPERQIHNPIFFELESLNRINDEIFHYFHKTWSDFDWLPDRSDYSDYVCSRFQATISDFIQAEFGNAEVIGLKDPRFCYTLPLWEAVLTSLGFEIIYVLVRRSASAVFESNRKVNHHSRATNFRLVTQSHFLAARFVQSRPNVSIFYEELLQAPAGPIRQICQAANLPMDHIPAASAVLNKNLQHHTPSKEASYKYFPGIVDAKEIAPEEYDRYREIYLAATEDKNKVIERLKSELTEKEQGGKDFPYWREALKISTSFWTAITTLIPPNSHRRRFAKFLTAGLLGLYRRIRDRKYQNWIVRFEALTEEDRRVILKRIEALERKPLISVLMPVYNPPLKYLEDAIKSVTEQVYPHWELCIADDASPNPLVRNLIEKHAVEDARIRYVFRNSNGHISAASNSALELVTGEYTALLDHDDVLSPLALYYVSEEINANPKVAVIYSDEDRLTETGKRAIPYFKPDFDYDLLLSQNMVSHLGVYRTEMVRKMGGFRIGLEGSQDYDLLLRIVEVVESHQIRHIPRVLYHWRVSGESTAAGANAKPYAYEAALQALKDHLARKGVEANVESVPGLNAQRIIYTLPKKNPAVEIIICALSRTEALERCVYSILLNTDYGNYRLIINLTGDSSLKQQADHGNWSQDDRISVIQNTMGSSQMKLINQAVASSHAEYVCLLDENTAGFRGKWLEHLLGQAIQPGVGAVGPLILQPNSKIFQSGLILKPDEIAIPLFAGRPKYPSYYGWATIQKGFSVISEACQVIGKSHFLDIGGLDESISNRHYANIDFCLKLREKGLRNVVSPVVELYLHQSSTHNLKNGQKVSAQELRDKKNIKGRWQAWLNYDPAFNPNLELRKGMIILTPPRHFKKKLS